MSTKLVVSIPKPCSENWSAMTAVEQGRFCQSCQKKVFDFTQSSDREIAKAIQSNSSLCGRFANTQLNRELIVPKEKSSIWLATTSAVISFLGLGTDELIAQEKQKVEQTEGSFLKGKPTIEAKIKAEFTVSGVVSDEIGPLPGANVYIKGTSKGVQTDMNGKFSINAKVNDVLVFSFIGFKEKVIKVKAKNKNLNVKLNSSKMIMGVVIIQE